MAAAAGSKVHRHVAHFGAVFRSLAISDHDASFLADAAI